MKKIFIAYADGRMAYSLKRIGRQARRLGVFDDIVLYTPEDLPAELKSSPLMQHSYGGGYWAWKPWIIQHTLDTHEDGDVVCYVDAGCTLHKAPEWKEYLGLMERYDTVLFEYPDEMPVWEKFGTTSTKIKHWAKRRAVEFYDGLVGGEEWREHNKILGGFLFVRGRNNPIIRTWLDIVCNHPEIIDDSGVFDDQFPFFVRHKHDQPMLTALSCKYPDSCKVMPELLDEGPSDAAVVAERVRVGNLWQYMAWLAKKAVRKILGTENAGKLKTIFKK